MRAVAPVAFGIVALAIVALGACAPELGERDSLVRGTRVLAVRAEPPEAAPGEEATYTPLVVGPDGARDANVAWAFCTAPKPLAENDVVTSACLGDAVVDVGVGPTARASMPPDACALFGPDPPPGGYRPRDPDVTGGYYQPLRAVVDGAPTSFVLERIACPLANAPTDVATDFGKRYARNRNPHLSLDAPTRAAPGAKIALRASWGDADAEAYVTFDLASQSLVDRREAMRVSWFATAGTFDADRTGRAEDDRATTSDNGWTAPASGAAHLWVVLRDARGGLDWVALDVVVGP